MLVKWAHVPADMTTWEDYYVLKARYPDAALWEEEALQEVTPQGGANVTPSP